MGALRREVSELKNGTSGLAEQVSTLALALQAVGQLQSRQAKVEAKVHEVEKKTISKAEAAAMQAEADRRLSAKRKRDVTKIYSLLGLITTVAVMIGLFVVNYLSDPVFSPLDNSRVQKINSVVAGTTGPAVLLGKDVSVTGTKCNTTDRPVAVQGVTTWVTVTPAGTALEAGRGTGERPPGCTTKTFDNAMPVGVVARTKELHDAGVKHVIWQVTGLETPVSKQRASSARWTTEPFEIVVP